MIAVFDIGGTSIKYGVADQQQRAFALVFQDEFASNAKAIKGPGILANITARIMQLKEAYPIEGIAISTAGMVDAQEGTILYANENIPAYTGMKVKAVLEQQFSIPCWVENDVNAAALGEALYGAGKEVNDLVMLTIGTGIGGAVILDRKIYHGHSRSAGEIGYMMINGQAFQDIASTSALVSSVERATKMSGLSGKVIFDRAKQLDPVCLKAIEQQCDIIMQGITNCVCLLNPQMVVLGGGIMAQKTYLEPIMNRYAQQYLNEQMKQHVRIAFAQLGNHAGLAGAYAYYIEKEGIQYA